MVFALVRAGGAVDANAGVKNCTPLHMAARRGNEEVAQAVLDCGANIEACDSVGDTPLRRAVNCDKTRVPLSGSATHEQPLPAGQWASSTTLQTSRSSKSRAADEASLNCALVMSGWAFCT